MTELKCFCIHCGGPMQFPENLQGEKIICPHCQKLTVLGDAKQEPPIIPARPSAPIRRPPNFSGFICESCGHKGKPKAFTKGSILIEIVLWLFFIVPGLIYSLWRLTSREKGCPHCAGHMIPANSPRGRALHEM